MRSLRRSLRLAPELIPVPCLGHNLHTVLPPAEWDTIRWRCYVEAGHRCEVCGRRDEPLHCHEVWAYDDGRHIQRLIGLQALCELCHFAKNECGWPSFALGSVRLPLSGQRITHAEFVAYWCQQNKCGEAIWQREAQAAYLKWMRRSRHEDWRQNYGQWARVVAHHTSGPAMRAADLRPDSGQEQGG